MYIFGIILSLWVIGTIALGFYIFWPRQKNNQVGSHNQKSKGDPRNNSNGSSGGGGGDGGNASGSSCGGGTGDGGGCGGGGE